MLVLFYLIFILHFLLKFVESCTRRSHSVRCGGRGAAEFRPSPRGRAREEGVARARAAVRAVQLGLCPDLPTFESGVGRDSASLFLVTAKEIGMTSFRLPLRHRNPLESGL